MKGNRISQSFPIRQRKLLLRENIDELGASRTKVEVKLTDSPLMSGKWQHLGGEDCASTSCHCKYIQVESNDPFHWFAVNLSSTVTVSRESDLTIIVITYSTPLNVYTPSNTVLSGIVAKLLYISQEAY